MAKPKQRQLVAMAPNKNNASSVPETELAVEDSWVVVKKQRVRILIPSLPVNEQCTTPNVGPSQSQARSRKTITSHSQCPAEICLQVHSVDEGEKSISLAPKIGIPTAKRSPRPTPKTAKLPRLDSRIIIRSENPDHVNNYRSSNALGVHISSKIRKQPLSFLSAGVLLNQRMRAWNLERKLQRAGGLSCWLASLGLGQFVRIFHGKSVNKFQLVNLTMKKLKDMGANAVGPRRKLMHAIDCLCQPCCFEAM